MDKLRKKIIKYFVICAVAISIAESISSSILEIIMEHIILPKYEQNPNSVAIVLILFATVSVSILILVCGALIFYRLVRKAVDEESLRRTAEQNMLYSCIAHDLKTPMTSVQGFAAALRDGKIKDEEQGEICDIIYMKTKHMNELVDTLSAYSKLGTESFSLNIDEVNICTLVRDIAAMNYSDFESQGIEMIIDIPDKSIIRALDKKEFTRAVNNVMVNACRHNSAGCRVLVKVHTEGEYAYITIADTGEPISKDLAANIFDPFVCGNASRTSGTGSGLGLAVSARIAEKHGVNLWYSTDIEGFSKGFIFKMPAD